MEETEPEPEAIAWPYLKITGVIGKGLRGAATINNRIVACGETVDGVEVVSVGEYGVKLEFRRRNPLHQGGQHHRLERHRTVIGSATANRRPLPATPSRTTRGRG